MNNEVERTKSILVIDDDPRMLKLLKDILGLEGYDVKVAVDGVSGMTLLKETEVDLVLLDILMPGPDGYQVLQSIQQYSNVPIIMVTTVEDIDSAKKSLNLGADDYVTKPFHQEELKLRIRNKLKRAE